MAKRIRQKAGKGHPKKKRPRKDRRGGKRRTSWAPGKSGNPKGRTPLPGDYKLAMEDLGPRGLQALADIVDNPGHPRHAHVCEYVINRWKGTPTVKTEMSGPGGGPIPIKAVRTSDEKRARMRQLADKARALVEAGARRAAAGEDEPSGSD